jgi:NAD(P)-dependent dehydrogenase (short-subunit alcohol dehydrogenase family)
MELRDRTAVVTGGSRGLGLGVVEALAAQGAHVTVVARTAADLEAVSRMLRVPTIQADVTDQAEANRIVGELRPTILVLNAGVTPPMGPLDDLTWEMFTAPWETDVKAGLYWIQAALKAPLAPGSRVLAGSSGAALQGSPMSGGYAGAKRMLWLMANYANVISKKQGLGIRFQTVVPLQMVAKTGVGDTAADAYGRNMGVSPLEFLARFGAPMSPRQFGNHVISLLTEAKYETALAFGMKGDSGLTVLEEATA